MKTSFALTTGIALATLSLDSASAMKSFLNNLPNGKKFSQALGHVSDSDTALNAFGKLYQSKDGEWTALCKEMFPDTKFTVGAALGDPCCTWKKGGEPDFEVAAFTKPTEGKVCAANTPAATSAAPAANATTTPPPTTKAPTSTTPAPTTKAPTSTTSTPTATTVAPAGNSTTPATTAPAGNPSASKPPSGNQTFAPSGKPTTVKPKPSKCGARQEAKSLEDESDGDDVDFNYAD